MKIIVSKTARGESVVSMSAQPTDTNLAEINVKSLSLERSIYLDFIDLRRVKVPCAHGTCVLNREKGDAESPIPIVNARGSA